MEGVSSQVCPRTDPSPSSFQYHPKTPFLLQNSSALRSCWNTCEGPDGVHYQMLRPLPPPSLSFLLTLFNHIWLIGDFPPQWREALILLFLKPNSLPQDYRPIALTSCICKLLEHMVNSGLVWFLESKSLLSPSQYGLRWACSTAEPLAFLESYIITAFARHDSVLAIFFDLEKAYDTTWRYHILHQPIIPISRRSNHLCLWQ